MGIMPPHDPQADPAFSWLRATVIRVEDANGPGPARVTLEVREIVRRATTVGFAAPIDAPRPEPTAIPPQVVLTFGPTRSMGQEAFYIQRANMPDMQEQLEALGRRRASFPQLGTEVILWVTEVAPGAWAVGPDDPRWRDVPVPAPSWWDRLWRKAR